MLTMNARWGLPLAMAGTSATGHANALSRRNERSHVEKLQRDQDLQAWENESPRPASPYREAATRPGLAGPGRPGLQPRNGETPPVNHATNNRTQTGASQT